MKAVTYAVEIAIISQDISASVVYKSYHWLYFINTFNSRVNKNKIKIYKPYKSTFSERLIYNRLMWSGTQSSYSVLFCIVKYIVFKKQWDSKI